MSKKPNEATNEFEEKLLDLSNQRIFLTAIKDDVMKLNVHYGKIPHCGDKLNLLKPGAEVLCVAFKLVATFEVENRSLPEGHEEYDIKCVLTEKGSGEIVAQGVGYGASIERKHQKHYDNPANILNTVLKVAKKRAFVDATITATATSDLFTQDGEDPDHGFRTWGNGRQGNPALITAVRLPNPAEEREEEVPFSKTCPSCGVEAIIKGNPKYGGGWVCWKKRDGCGKKFTRPPQISTVSPLKDEDVPF